MRRIAAEPLAERAAVRLVGRDETGHRLRGLGRLARHPRRQARHVAHRPRSPIESSATKS